MFSLCSPPDQIHTGFQLSRTGSPSLQAQSGIAADLPQAHKTGKDLKLCPISRHILRKCTFQFQSFGRIKHPPALPPDGNIPTCSILPGSSFNTSFFTRRSTKGPIGRFSFKAPPDPDLLKPPPHTLYEKPTDQIKKPGIR